MSRAMNPSPRFTSKALAFTALLASTSLLSGCFGNDSGGTGDTLATVNGEAIKSSRMDEQLAQIPAQIQAGREAEVKQVLLERLIDQALVAQEFEKLNLDKNTEYQKQLEAVTLQLQANVVMAEHVSNTLTTARLQQEYDANRDKLAFPAVKAKHILVPTEADARAILAIATPANFSQLAIEKSQGPSAKEGGDLGWFRREQMIPEFAQLAFSTQPGTIASQPVKTQFGWHVILVEERNDRYLPPLEQVSNELRQGLAQQVIQSYLKDLRNAAKITYADGMAPSPTTVPAAQ
jgi:peptidyl-prolyl cis-trans isomerase C